MHVFALLSGLLALAPVFALAAPATPVLGLESRTAAPDEQLPGARPISGLAGNTFPRAETNSERLGRGLAPLPPKRLNQAMPRNPTPSPHPHITKRAVIRVNRVSDNKLVGYMGKHQVLNTYGYVQRGAAMTVSYSYDVGATIVSQADITCLDNTMGYPLLGLGGGMSVVPGESVGGVFLSTNPTPPGSPPLQAGNSYWPGIFFSESAVWIIDVVTGGLTVQWINPDESQYPTYLYYIDSPDAWNGLFFTGELNPDADVEFLEVRFTLVNIP